MHHRPPVTDARMVSAAPPPTRENVYLVGPMGSGKTTLGRRIASRLGLEFIDCDLEIEHQTGVSVNLIFDIEGERGFRERETEILRALSKRKGMLVATGGGAVLRPENRQLMQKSGLVVWLRTSVEHQINRLGRDRTRPLLQATDREQRLRQLASERNPLYEEIADLVFESSHKNVKVVSDQLFSEIRLNWPKVSDE